VGSDGGGVPIAALVAVPLLGVVALTLATVASGGLALRRRPACDGRRKVDDHAGDHRDHRFRRRFPSVPGSGTGSRRRSRPRSSGRAFPQSQETEPVEGATQGKTIVAEATSVPVRDAAASFEPISLAMLEERATLATRSDRKYILCPGTFERLVGEITADYLILEIDGVRVFPYDTVYFDTPEWTIYHQHIQGRRKRYKCRTRLYAPTALCFFEVKLKGGRGETIKRRLEIETDQHGSVSPSSLSFLDRELRQAYGSPGPADLMPALTNFYRRLTLVGREDSERLTFDFELLFGRNGKDYLIQPGRIMLETKADGGFGEANLDAGAGKANRVLQRLGVRPIEYCSKYCIGAALANPELRDNPFRRLIRQHFDPRHRIPARAYGGSVNALPRSNGAVTRTSS
jgi:hypothetical protein